MYPVARYIKLEVFRERVLVDSESRIDIYIESAATKTAVVIENKVFTDNHDDQLYIVDKSVQIIDGMYSTHRKGIQIALLYANAVADKQSPAKLRQKPVSQPVRLTRIKEPANERRVFDFLPLHPYGVEDICLYIFNQFDFIELCT